ncbi:pimeloyl-[acyl-carrier protein] methyl ester esterase [Buchnera aphidicola (Hyadaphis tataricae)]|uniref:Pimeloyl-[acyl-carrier protein] methyl ester esterase n=1 Tax=Buchnera aphidicola (Hyadaphis tataricae) TaxID=1241859 RepID=A0A4D6XZQ2_9GAMM|nr:pimeloyl-ACP methyl ester esterase BioH [Buchnera aphidicola]QCI21817.1 pimeloyl-[acyl-carrier protein] methyl ester esterase [Buchnera aphidicola (Hyadaphis tataricae)]
MQNFYWNTIGKGKINIVLLSGWGINVKIWLFIIKQLPPCFKFHLIDLPGLGKNKELDPMKIDQIIYMLHCFMPKKSIWLGWSMGGLIASRFALSYPNDTLAIVSVASSPCFIKKDNWPGLEKNVIKQFYINLKTNYQKTIKNFIYLQMTDSNKSMQDWKVFKNILSIDPDPNLKSLKNGLDIISSTDIRLEMMFLKVPLLRVYGHLDSLVPKKIITILDIKWPNTYSKIIKKAAHIPFLSHKKEFCFILLQFIRSLRL